MPPASPLRLLKLHGSLTWFWSTGDPTGSTLEAWLPEQYGDLAQCRLQVPGREPFLVPPTTLKSPYLQMPLVREIWRQAYV